MSASWPRVPLGEVLQQRKEFITISDTKTYIRPTVRLNARGIVQRDEVTGAVIKTKSQQVCRAGEFLVAEIDAKHGGFGIVPPELAGSIVSSHYFLFELNCERVDPRFFAWAICNPDFAAQVRATGSTNYAAIRPSHVLHYTMALPTLADQRRVADRLDSIATRTAQMRKEIDADESDANALIISTHHQLAGNRKRRLGDILALDEDAVPITAEGSYPQVGVKSFGGGLFPKAAVAGTETTYKTFNRLYDGALLLSQVKGWEGALAICPPNLAGWFVSPEYRTFRVRESEARPGYLAALVGKPWFWRRLSNATRGIGARRERTRPEQFLTVELPMPDADAQEKGEQLFAKIAALRSHHAALRADLDALLPSVIDRAFNGEL